MKKGISAFSLFGETLKGERHWLLRFEKFEQSNRFLRKT
jgi:hypothetical protein